MRKVAELFADDDGNVTIKWSRRATEFYQVDWMRAVLLGFVGEVVDMLLRLRRGEQK